jgi:hypothetical protein
LWPFLRTRLGPGGDERLIIENRASPILEKPLSLTAAERQFDAPNRQAIGQATY